MHIAIPEVIADEENDVRWRCNTKRSKNKESDESKRELHGDARGNVVSSEHLSQEMKSRKSSMNDAGPQGLE